MRESWGRLQKFANLTEHDRATVDFICANKANTVALDASKIDFHIPESVMQSCEREFKRGAISDIYHGGKLNLAAEGDVLRLLLSLVKVWSHSDSFDLFCGVPT